ncbi:hypothetical protein BDN70DRAFT_936196 [Pholiota conissans]|uniref:Uncharacterized protein n=1 Tax=Pholiota conissans TaxID=109636 RepID=A0A9P5YT18_9AGAR|nr:hypothetical protein BDN70DRAFT_936196 [Pholiota conissans]
MASQFEFSQQQRPIPRPAGRGGAASASGPRESSALRASVLDAALELGLVGNAGWMFDNALQEENEDEDQTSSPALTYGSSVTSEESFPSILSPSSSSEAHTNANANATFLPSSSNQPPRSGLGGIPPLPTSVRKEPVVRIVEPEFIDRSHSVEPQAGIPFPESSIPVRPTTPGGGRKLKKKKALDGYESDGGYMSDAGKKKDKKKDKEKKSDLGLMKMTADMEMPGMVETSKEAKKRAKEEKKEAEAERKRTKSLLSAAKAARKKEANGKDGGYETDGGGKSKSKSKKSSADASGYETDGTPKKAKSRFFKLGSRASSKTDLHADVEEVPPMPFPTRKEPEKEVLVLPIAERFATTLSPDFFNTPTVPPLAEGRSLSPFPPLTFQSLGASTSSATSPISPGRNAAAVVPPSVPDNRNSQVSAISSTSSGSRSHTHTDGASSKHHGTDSHTSYSTITSSAAVHLPSGGVLAPTASISSSSSAGSKSGFLGLGGRNALRPPAVSFSTSRSPSPSRPPPVAPLSLVKGPGLRLKASLDNLLARNGSPSPISPAPSSPFVIVPSPTASQSSVPSPKAFAGLPPSPNADRSRHTPPEGSGSGFGVGFGLRARSPAPQAPRTVISAPNTALAPNAASPLASASLSPILTTGGNTHGNISTNSNTLSLPPNVDSPTHLIIPSSQYVVPSPRNSGLPPSPNLLAYYDLPPPSPAPQGPLPTPPSGFPPPSSPNPHINIQTHLPSPAALRQRVIDRTPRTLPPELSAALHRQASVQRGRESPFPTRPILPVVVAAPPAPAATASVGLEARLATRRYRDLYALLPGGVAGASASDMEKYYEEKEQAMELRRARRAGEREHSWIMDAEDGDERTWEGDEDDEVDSEEMQGVIERFAREDAESSEGHSNARALGRRRSFDALQTRAAGPFEFEDDGRTVGDRLSRWSGSIYSRSSILDPDESGETRERLVKQVEAMLDAERRGERAPVEGERGYVPPVPRLPAAYANMGSQLNTASPGRSWNRF